MIAKSQNAEIAEILKKELGLMNNIWSSMDQVILETTDDYLEQMGNLVQKIQNIIEKQAPHRERNLFVLIRNTTKRLENKIKIWKSV